MSTQTSARRRLQRVSVSNRIRRAWVLRPPTRIGRQEFFVEPEHIVVVDAWVAQRIEGAEGGLVGRSTKKQTEIASRCSGSQQPLDDWPDLREGRSWEAFAMCYNIVHGIVAQKPVD